MSKGSFVVGLSIAVLLLPSLAAARSIERIRVAGPGVTSAFPRKISVKLLSPPSYRRQSHARAKGSWVGPQYWASGKRDLGGNTSIQWKVAFKVWRSSTKAAALAAPTHGWPLDKKNVISVPHYVGKKVVGTIRGYYVLTQAPEPNDASYQAVVAFPLGPRALSIVTFDLAQPATDSAGQWGNYLVAGLDLPSIWNRGQAFWALSGVRLLGNLPPTMVVASASGHVVRGSVSDAFHHPVLHVPVWLQRRVGARWQRLRTTKTSLRGSFSVHSGQRGVYRAVAVFRGKRVVSRTVYVS